MTFEKIINQTKGTILFICLFIPQGAIGQKKNLLIIMTDQQRYDALGIAGNTVLQTPNLDRLARSGAYFKNAYTPCAVCAPARASILTGYTVENTGVYSNDITYDYKGEGVMTMPTFDEILSQNGYRCEYYGKWHTITSKGDVYQNPVKYTSGGKYIFGSGGAAWTYREYLSENQAPVVQKDNEFIESVSKFPYIPDPIDKYYGMTQSELDAQGIKHDQSDQHGQLLVETENTETAFEAKEAIKAIERLKDQAFSITCSFHFPHPSMTPAKPYYGMYPPENLYSQISASINDKMENSPYINANSRLDDTEYADPNKITYMISNYYGLIKEIDDWVGKILDKLDEHELTDNTMIIFVSDHGEMLGAHGMNSKNIFLDESARIPLIISSPGDIQPGTTVDGYVSNIDLFATILDYLDVPEHVSDGKSLRGLIEGTDTIHGKYVVTEWDRDNISNYMVIKDGWKLIIPYTIQSEVINTMYDLNTDPHEMNNLLGSNPDRVQYQNKAEELRACLLEWLAEKNSVHYYSVSQRDLLNGGKPTGNNAAFVSQVIPTLVPGETVTVSITMKNTGTTTWVPAGNFRLGSQSPAGNKIWGLDRVSLNAEESIAPNTNKTFTFDITVPAFDGIFNFQWQMIQEGEEWFGSKSEIEQQIIGNPGSYLDNCDEITDWKDAYSIILISSGQKQGAGCLEYTGGGVGESSREFYKKFSTPFDPGVTEENAVLQFWYYINDASKIGTSNQIELGSGGIQDVDEYNWKLNGRVSDGWNFLSLKISEAGKKGNPDINAINWFRIYDIKLGPVTSRLDAIQILDPTKVSSSLIVNSTVDKLKVNIYPNPLNQGMLTIDLIGYQELNNIDITFSNLMGQTVYQMSTPNRKEIIIDTEGLLNELMYVVTVKAGNSIVSNKLIILKSSRKE